LRVMNRRRTTAVVLAVAVHIGFVLLLLGRRADPAMSSDTVMQVNLVPDVAKVRPPEHPRSVPRAPPILHRPVETPLPPREAPPAYVALPGRAEPSPPPPAASDTGAAGLQRALKGRLGCANPNLAALSETERAACDERLGQDVANARAYPVISPKLKKVFDRTFECKPDDDWCLYRMGKGPYPGLAGMLRKKKKTDWD
jgi:hypothetical protein